MQQHFFLMKACFLKWTCHLMFSNSHLVSTANIQLTNSCLSDATDSEELIGWLICSVYNMAALQSVHTYEFDLFHVCVWRGSPRSHPTRCQKVRSSLSPDVPAEPPQLTRFGPMSKPWWVGWNASVCGLPKTSRLRPPPTWQHLLDGTVAILFTHTWFTFWIS